MSITEPTKGSVARIVAIFIVVAHYTVSQASQATWPQFRGPGGLGIAPDNKAYPAELDMKQNLQWKIDVPKGHSSPCVWGNRLFITARSGKALETICIDRENGEAKWRKSIEPERLEKKISPANSHASPTPVCDGERVYVYFGSFGVIAHDLDGNKAWQKPLPVLKYYHGSAASPILANNMIIINYSPQGEAYVLAIDRDTGETVWKQEHLNERAGWSTPALWKHGEEEELVVFSSHKLISYDLKDGHKRWWLYNLPVRAICIPVFLDETLFMAASVNRMGDPVNPLALPDFEELLALYDDDGNKRLTQAEIPEDLAVVYRGGPRGSGIKRHFRRYDADRDGTISDQEWEQVLEQVAEMQPRKLDALVAIRSGGKGDVRDSHITWRTNEGVGQVPSPLVYQDRLYLVKHGGIVTCFNAETGERKYSEKLGQRAYYLASPVAADGKIYFCSYLGKAFVVQAGDEFKLLSQNKLGKRISATPALVDGNVYLRTDKHLMAFGN